MTSPLPTRTLGCTGFETTVLGFGAMELREEGPRGRGLSETEAGRILGNVLDHGINLIDTSIDYGLSEERIGRHLSHRRDEFVLATKCGCTLGWRSTEQEPGPGPHDYSRSNIVAGVEQSLRRLATDHLDVLQVHMSPSLSVMEEHDVIGTLRDLQEQGKVRFIGMSGTLPNLPDHLATRAFDVVQIPYSLLQRDHETLISRAAETGAGVIIRGGVARGALSGPDGQLGGPARVQPHVADAWQHVDLRDLLDGSDPVEFTLRYTISHPAMTSAIVGTIDPDHLGANVHAAIAGPLPPEVYEETQRRLDAVGLSPTMA